MVERLFLAVPLGCLQFVIVVFPDHTHLLFLGRLELFFFLFKSVHLQSPSSRCVFQGNTLLKLCYIFGKLLYIFGYNNFKVWKIRFVVFVFNVLLTTEVIWRWGYGLKSHPTDC